MAEEPSQPVGTGYAETYVADASQFSKEQQDIALAAAVLRSGTLTERQLASALSTWTIHGSTSLADHLVQQQVISQEVCQRLLQQAQGHLRAQQQTIAESAGNGRRSGSSVLSALDAIDGSGTVARLLGIRAASAATVDEAHSLRQTDVRYRLVRKLGQGGLGRVWLAFDESMKRFVAVKEIMSSDDPAAVARFRREAEITGRLEHPGIVPVYELGEDAQTGETFYAMRFLGKQTLHDAIMEYHERRSEGSDNPMLIRQLLTAFVSVCQAIGHAHSRKVIHRDLKPENVAIDSFGQVIVIDWGLAKVIDEVGAADNVGDPFTAAVAQQSTLDGQVLGTPLYMAPEQASGRIDELDERTDIYGLGAILFAILTGNAPHEQTRSGAESAGTRDLISAIASRPTPLARKANPDVNPALAAICAKAMARRQYARYESASQLADDVQRWMAGEPVSAYREKTSQRIARWIGRHRIWSQVIAGLAIVGLVTLATLGIASRQHYVAQRQAHFDEMRGQEREIEVQLLAAAEDLAQDGRFMSVLPPIRGIIDARGGVIDGESEETWRERLEKIYEGLLRANPDYLAVSYAAAEPSGQEIVRVERHTSDAAYVRRVPASRLKGLQPAELLAKVTQLPPGEVMLWIDRPAADEMAAREGVRLIAAVPVYDDVTGSLFGVVAVEANLIQQIVKTLDGMDQREATIYITDSTGEIWVTSAPDVEVQVATKSNSVSDALPQVRDHFAGGDRRPLLDRAHGCIAELVPLDPANPDTSVGIVFQLAD